MKAVSHLELTLLSQVNYFQLSENAFLNPVVKECCAMITKLIVSTSACIYLVIMAAISQSSYGQNQRLPPDRAAAIMSFCKGGKIDSHFEPSLESYYFFVEKRSNSVKATLGTLEDAERWSFVVYLPIYIVDLLDILMSVRNELENPDENTFLGWKAVKAHFICLTGDAGIVLQRSTSFFDDVIPHGKVYGVFPGNVTGDFIKDLRLINGGDNVTEIMESPGFGADWGQQQDQAHQITERTTSSVRIHVQRMQLKLLVQLPTDDAVKEHLKSEGLYKDLRKKEWKFLADFQDTLDFDYTTIAGEGWPYYLMLNGTSLNGLGHQIMTGEADISISPMSITLLRASKLHFLQPINFAENAIIYQGQGAMLYSRPLLLLTFSMNLWIAVFLTCLVGFGVALLVCKVLACLSRHVTHNPVISVLAVFLCQGSAEYPQFYSLRIISLVISLTSSILYIAYSGAFVATVTTPTTSVHSYSRLKTLGFKVFTDPSLTTYSSDFVEDAADEQELLRQSYALYKSKSDMMEKILNPMEKYAIMYRKALFYETAFAHGITDRSICSLSFIPCHKENRVMEGLVMRKGSPLREPFSQKTILLMERGLVMLYRNRYERNIQPPCHNTWKCVTVCMFWGLLQLEWLCRRLPSS